MMSRGPPQYETTQENTEAHAKSVSMITAEIEQLITEHVTKVMAFNLKKNGRVKENNGAGASNLVSRMEDPTRGCTYEEFQNFNPGSFNGTEGAVGCVNWFERMETIFRIGNCTESCKVKYAACTLQGNALTWWNSYVQSIGVDAAYMTSWEDVKRMMLEEYCPSNESQRLEKEFWNLAMKGADINKYTKRFQELAPFFPTMVLPEYKGIEKYILGLPPQFQDMMTSPKPTTIQDAIRIARKLAKQMMHQGTTDPMETYLDGKRKWEDDQFEQSTGLKIKKRYQGNRPLCNQCGRHHQGSCTITCTKCKKKGHFSRDCKVSTTGKFPLGSCFNCGEEGHFKDKCPKLEKQKGKQVCSSVVVIKTEDDH